MNEPQVWHYLRTVVRALFPGIIVLHLAGSDQPNMDKLYFYVRRLDNCLEKSKELLDTIQEKLFATSVFFKEYTSEDSEAEDDEGFAIDTEESSVEPGDSGLDSLPSLGTLFIDCWKKRREKLVHDYSISGWLLCPIPEVMEDARKYHKGSDRNAMERLFRKLFLQPGGEAVGDNSMNCTEVIDKFWEEFEMFQSKTGDFGGGREYIWATKTDLVDGSSYLWHKKYSFKHTDWLGKFACRVTSKILGIGGAERNWGEVKQLKTDKRSHLGGERTKKQATIFGSDCAERAKIQREAVRQGGEPEDATYKFWDDNDFDAELAFDNVAHENLKRGPMRIVKCWVEDWEEGAVLSNDSVSEAKLLKKYGGLEWMDIDNNILCRTGKMTWRGRKPNKGWNVDGYMADWVETDLMCIEHEELWAIDQNCPLHVCLYEYYTKKRSKECNILAMQRDGTSMVDDDAMGSDGSDYNGGSHCGDGDDSVDSDSNGNGN